MYVGLGECEGHVQDGGELVFQVLHRATYLRPPASAQRYTIVPDDMRQRGSNCERVSRAEGSRIYKDNQQGPEL